MRRQQDPWQHIEVRHLEALDRVVAAGSFAAAADGLGYVPSAISQQVAFVEGLLGRRLIERPRGASPLRPTPAGEVVIAHARAVLGRLRDAERALAELASPRCSALALGAERGVGEALLGELLERASLRGLAVGAETGDDARARLEDGRLDAALVDLPAGGAISAVEVRREPYVLAAAAASPLARRGRVGSLRELAGTRLVEQPRCAADRLLRHRLRASGVPFESAHRASGRASALALAAAVEGAALVPRGELAEGDRALHAVDVRTVVADRVVGLAWPRSRDDDPRLGPLRAIALELAAPPAVAA